MLNPPRGRLWLVYMLRCRDGSLYTGMTNNLLQRLLTHESGRGSKYVASRRPFELAWWRACDNSTDARKQEAAIKKLSRAQKLELVENG